MDKRIIIIASALIAVLAVVASGAGLFMNGLYNNDTKSGAAQEQGNDLVTLVLCVPLFVVSTYYAAKGSLRGRLVWTGMVFYFLYVYAMMAFLSAYNQLFLAYVAAFSLSLYTFAYSMLTLDVEAVKQSFAGAPTRAAAGFMFLIVVAVSAMWLGMIMPSLISGERPAALETYTTLVVQALDLGVIVPMSLITGVLLLQKKAWGYALASLIFVKGITLGTAVLSMALFMSLNGVEVVLPQVIMFVVLVLGALALAIMFYGKMKTPAAPAA
jgi:hypothetical protein